MDKALRKKICRYASKDPELQQRMKDMLETNPTELWRLSASIVLRFNKNKEYRSDILCRQFQEVDEMLFR